MGIDVVLAADIRGKLDVHFFPGRCNVHREALVNHLCAAASAGAILVIMAQSQKHNILRVQLLGCGLVCIVPVAIRAVPTCDVTIHLAGRLHGRDLLHGCMFTQSRCIIIQIAITTSTSIDRIALLTAGRSNHSGGKAVLVLLTIEINDIVTGVIVPIFLLDNGVPLFQAAAEVNFLETGAAVEGILADPGHTARNDNAGHAVAILKGSSLDAGHALRDDDAEQIAALGEHSSAHVGHTLGDVDAHQLAAFRKCILTDPGHTIRYGDAGQAATSERKIANLGHAVRYGNAGQAAAIVERIIINAKNTVANHNIGQTTTIIECTISNANHTVRNRDAR